MRPLLLVLAMMIPSQVYPMQKSPLRIDATAFPPTVSVLGDSAVYGFEIELSKAVAEELGYSTQFRVVPFSRVFDGIRHGTADLAIGGITVTDRREQLVDFSYPYLEGGFSVLSKTSPPQGVREMLRSLVDVESLRLAGVVLLVAFVVGTFMFLFERKCPGSDFIGVSIPLGLWRGFYVALVNCFSGGPGDLRAHTVKGQILTLLSIIVIVHTVIGLTITRISGMVQRAGQEIVEAPEDLAGHRVATKTGTVAVDALRQCGAEVIEKLSAQEAFQAVECGETEFAVFDTPVVRAYAASKPGAVAVHSIGFGPQRYGFVLPEGSPLREEVNRALLKLIRQGTFEQLQHRWFH
ncbi:MAG: transporter substrate-binding domain-containing protein [Oligoflexia bacterium]|nr:transporter substrate-binding domain-containing protein [Oligoflexia bacterium]